MMRCARVCLVISTFSLLVGFGLHEDCSSCQHSSDDSAIDTVSLLQSYSAFTQRDLVSHTADANRTVVQHLAERSSHSRAPMHGLNAGHASALTQTGRSNATSYPADLKFDGFQKPEGSLQFTFTHPKGVVSNVYNGAVVWAKVWMIDIHKFFALTFVAYPVFLIPFAIIGAVMIGMCLEREDADAEYDGIIGPPAVATSQLTARSMWLYSYWCLFCRCIPSILVFVIPLILFSFSIRAAQEVYAVMLLVSSTFICSNGLYMTLFAPFAFKYLRRCMKMNSADVLMEVRADEKHQLTHWVIIPNFEEDEDILVATITAIARSTLAHSNICLLLAMEESEVDSERKSDFLRAKSEGMFKEVLTTFHPHGLPNDPPGKASNIAYAFKQLSLHLKSSSVDESRVMLTIADADTEFHEVYFEALTREYFQTEKDVRNISIWQSVVLHLKNYHRQPGPVIVGTMFTSMIELSFMADPNGIRFPFSSYSIPFELATMVGGWDPEWIAEDWHMGIKCFLFTLGRAEVRPVMIPTLNYSPEGAGWFGTCSARWLQAKRHALGFSDLSYFFMMLPLIFLYTVSEKNRHGATMADFWYLVFKGLAYIVRLVNTHAIIGYLALYAALDIVLKFLMLIFVDHRVHIEHFFHRTYWAGMTFGFATTFFTFCVTINFQVIYHLVRDRIEEPNSAMAKWVFGNSVIHWAMTGITFIVAGPVFFICLAATVWAAAGRLLFSKSFRYEVASKPTKEQRSSR